MSPGWIIELSKHVEGGTPTIVRYSVRCSDRDRAKALVLDAAGALSDAKTFFIRPLTNEEIAQHELAEDEVKEWNEASDP